MYRNYLKPLFDFIGALLLLPVVLLVVAVCAPLIWLTDGGPVIYMASRTGQWCRQFKMFKLRTMYANAPDIRNADGSTYNADNDSRVTPIGRFLRKTSLDEVPQIINVILGQMSFVGPRPTMGRDDIDYHQLDGDFKNRFSVKPGITGYSQAYFRNSIPQDQKFHWDAYYARNVGLLLDMKIICETLFSVIGRKNINSTKAS